MGKRPVVSSERCQPLQRKRNFSLMTGSFRWWLCTDFFLKQTQPNPRLMHRVGHSIMNICTIPGGLWTHSSCSSLKSSGWMDIGSAAPEDGADLQVWPGSL
jgi:hypothetical protein